MKMELLFINVQYARINQDIEEISKDIYLPIKRKMNY